MRSSNSFSREVVVIARSVITRMIAAGLLVALLALSPASPDALGRELLSAAPSSPPAIAYVSDAAAGPGALGDDTAPFDTIVGAFNGGATELRITPGTYSGDVIVPLGDNTFRTWDGVTGAGKALDVPGQATIDGDLTLPGSTLALGPGFGVEVLGDFALGSVGGSQPSGGGSSGLFSLESDGFLTVVGDFEVGPDTDACSGETPIDEDDQCFDAGTPKDKSTRNRFFLGGGRADLFGDYAFGGTAQFFDDETIDPGFQGHFGDIYFRGATQQTLRHRQDEDAFFDDVTLNGDGGVLLLEDATQKALGTLTLDRGIIDTNDEEWDWIILNPGAETDLVGRNNAAKGTGVVELGSRDSYVNGGVQRPVEFSNATGGVITGGYLFPVGTASDPARGEPRDVDYFRPLILQLEDDLADPIMATVRIREDLIGEDLDFVGLIVDSLGGGDLTLDVLGNQFWQLEFDRIPSFDPNIRVEADELPNVFDPKSLRLIQWDCDGTNPRLAGLYDLNPGPDPSAVVNDFINGVLNLTHEGVDVQQCNLFGIASDSSINPIALTTPHFILNVDSSGEQPSDVFVDFSGRPVFLNAAGDVVDVFEPNGLPFGTIDLSCDNPPCLRQGADGYQTPDGYLLIASDNRNDSVDLFRPLILQGLGGSALAAPATTDVISVPVGDGPRGLAYDPATNQIYVATFGQGRVYVIDAETFTEVTQVITGGSPNDVAIDSSAGRAYVTNFNGDVVSVIDTATNQILENITVGDGPEGIEVDPETGDVWVANVFGGSVSVITSASIGSAQPVVDTFPVGLGSIDLAINPLTDTVWVANAFDDTVSIVDRTTHEVLGAIPVGDSPDAVAVSPKAGFVYVANHGDDTYSFISDPAPVVLGLPLLWGDDDCDGDADSVDALKNLQHLAALPFTQSDPCVPLGETVGVTIAGASQIRFGDVDCDGDVDSVDALGILRKLVALPVTQQPGCPEIGSDVLIAVDG